MLSDHQDYLEARRKRWFGIDRERDEPSILGERVYDLDDVGFKYHMNDLAAAVGLGNLPDMRAAILARHQQIARTYREQLSNVPGLSCSKKAHRPGELVLDLHTSCRAS